MARIKVDRMLPDAADRPFFQTPRPQPVAEFSQQPAAVDIAARKFAVRSDQIDNPGWIRKWRLNPARIDRKKQPAALNLRSHSLDKLRQIITTGAYDWPT